ncbi:hypothetical protein FSW04_18885 [Baekduia soli]|uniref:Uncharacterized protein n=1 Tax=Baekduia soli TaxID=496014 RepID=A0A5B8U9T9_9ACTN|nr:hypothetical protein [Baekduia soli]QEC49432.1 hypothetical protein FSW04_18885 [Baekduia soli]
MSRIPSIAAAVAAGAIKPRSVAYFEREYARSPKGVEELLARAMERVRTVEAAAPRRRADVLLATTSSTEGPNAFGMPKVSPAPAPTAPGVVTPLQSGSVLSLAEQRAEWASGAARSQRCGHAVAPFRPRADLTGGVA